jgi:hypothetical protein
VAELAKILRLVEEGVLSPEEADQILAALSDEPPPRPPSGSTDSAGASTDRARHLRIEITDNGKKTIDLRVPMNVASFAAGIVPGLPDAESERIREAIRTGFRGPILDITSEDGNRVLIASE